MRHLLFLVALLILSSSAMAQSWSANADGTGGSSCARMLSPGSACYYLFTASAAADSSLIMVKSYADVCFDPKLDGTGTEAAQVAVRQCTSRTAGANSCERVGVDVDGNGPVDSGLLDGDSGVSSGVQRQCIYDLGPGPYYIEVTTDPNSADTALVSMFGH